jgi:hypothetical protein
MEGPARYRRAFDWRINRADGHNNAAAAGGLTALFSSEMPEVLQDYLEISRKRRSNRLALARLQAHLIDELVSVETTVRHYRDKKKELERIEIPARNETVQDTSKDDLKFVERELFLWRAIGNVVRSIADGIAWRALGYDRAVLRALCQNRGSQQITSPGTIEELREWSRQFDHGSGIAILNSLTNWLTYGDITVVRNDGSVEVVEVKSSATTSSRIVRQKQRARELVTFLTRGRGKLEGKTVEVHKLDILPENGLDELRGLLKQTESSPGYASARLSNSAYVECVDLRIVAKDWMNNLTTQRQSLLADWGDNDHVHSSHSLDHLVFSPNLAPFSVFPFEPSLCIDLLTGAKAYIVSLNITAVGREFEHRGWGIVTSPIEVLKAGRIDEDFMTVKKARFRFTLPPASFMRMQMELLRPQVLIRQCELIRHAGPQAFESEFNLPVYEHEAQIWD